MKKTLTKDQKKADTDLWIIIITSLTILILFMMNQNSIVATTKDGKIPILLRTLYVSFFQFGVAGLGITIVSLFRKESFRQHGLNKKNIFKSIILSVICVIPGLVFAFVTKDNLQYLPFQGVWMRRELINSPFLTNILGTGIIALVWGFFEGFNYIVISDKINTRYPSNNTWLNWGAITCAVMGILIHGAVGIQPENFFEMFTIIFMVYGMIIIREKTGNAWGTIAIFIFYWNAL